MRTARAPWARATRPARPAAVLPLLLAVFLTSLPGRAEAGLCAGEVSESARGSWYRKVQSVWDPAWTGITGRVSLPLVSLDPARQMPKRPGDPSYWEGPLDRPSVYVGLAQGATEVDAGLAWQRELDDAGRPAVAEDGTPAFAFRPFWRVTRAGFSTSGPSRELTPSLRPGDRARLSLEIAEDGRLTLSVEGADQTWSTSIPAPGVTRGGAPRAFKRVNAIDQFRFVAGVHQGNEGFQAIPTRSSALAARWLSVGLRRADGSVAALAGQACRVAVGSERAASEPPAVRASAPNESGGETVDLEPGG